MKTSSEFGGGARAKAPIQITFGKHGKAIMAVGAAVVVGGIIAIIADDIKHRQNMTPLEKARLGIQGLTVGRQ